MIRQLKRVLSERAPRITGLYRTLNTYWNGRQWSGKGMRAFREIYDRNTWNDAESLSGSGSGLDATSSIRSELPRILAEYGIESLLDVPCGDFYWMSKVDLSPIQYTGVDLIPELISRVDASFAGSQRTFLCRDMTTGELPQADLLLCRDCLVHFSYSDIRKTLLNLRESGAEYLLTTTYPNHTFNVNCQTGHWRTINWQLAPFTFPKPLEIVWDDVHVGGKPGDKHLGLWRFDSLGDTLGS